jgi:hypothetical protein
MERTCTRSIKFAKIVKNIILGDNNFCQDSCNNSCDDKSNEDDFSQLTYGDNCGSCIPDVYIDSIEFVEGANGTISYSGCKDSKPNISQKEFSIRIPCSVSAFIVKVNVEYRESNVKVHWWIDLKTRQAIPLSLVKDGKNPCINSCFKNTSATVLACNSHILPCHYPNNKSNLIYTLTDKDSYVSPYNIYLFSSNIC